MREEIKRIKKKQKEKAEKDKQEELLKAKFVRLPNLVRNSAGQPKRKKTTKEICSIDNFNPGLSADKSKNLVDMANKHRDQVSQPGSTREGKKGISVAAFESLL